MKKINLLYKIILFLSILSVLSGCTNTGVSNNEDERNLDTIGGPTKYDSEGNPLYNEYGSEFENEWKSKDGNIKFILNNKLGIEGRGGYQGTYIHKGKSYEVEVCMEPDFLWIDADNIAYDDNDNTFILEGSYIKNDENNEFTLKVSKIYNGVKTKTNDIISSVYKVGDEIIFYQVSE